MITKERLEEEKDRLERMKIQLIAHLNSNAGKIELVEQLLEEIDKEGSDGGPRADET